MVTKPTWKYTITLQRNSKVLQELQFQGWLFQDRPFFKILATYMIHMYIEVLIIICLQVTGKMGEMVTINVSIIRSTHLCHYVMNFLHYFLKKIFFLIQNDTPSIYPIPGVSEEL